MDCIGHRVTESDTTERLSLHFTHFREKAHTVCCSRDITLSTKVRLVKAMVFPVVMYGCESWTIKKAERQRIDAFEWWCWRRLLRIPRTPRRSNQPILNQSWIFIGRTDAEAEALILWSPDAKNWLTGKDPDAGKDWRQEEKGATEDEMVGWHHRLDGHEFEQALEVDDGQVSLVCHSPWGHKELDTTARLNWTELKLNYPYEDTWPISDIWKQKSQHRNVTNGVIISSERRWMHVGPTPEL